MCIVLVDVVLAHLMIQNMWWYLCASNCNTIDTLELIVCSVDTLEFLHYRHVICVHCKCSAFTLNSYGMTNALDVFHAVWLALWSD